MSLTGPARELGRVFDQVADAYDAARPGYPDDLFRTLAEVSEVELSGATVVDVGAGTGISSRALRARGARVIAIDPGERMLARLAARTAADPTPAVPGTAGHLAAVRADGNALPIADGSADLVCYAQSWHWLDPATSIAEARRALRPSGRIAAWWNTTDHDQADWLAAYEVRLAESCPTYWGPAHPEWRVPQIAAVLDAGGLRESWVHWTRLVGIEDFLLNLRSHSYMAAMAVEAADELVARQRVELSRVYPGGLLSVPMRVYLAVGR
ncbi:class I SAM-dependent methyltransferase [Nonomuraea sp. NPDC046570]|uniref:class I SAM-dependent methyltransferase n=1 Tax=Nonomuraea sp. NPDC046570 TaxID=3155255 RepID=UPI0033EDA796